ncbi:hypothetical protein FKP32DRAFT_168799 [Trametes sanguinea]|nr:hypothetical protein FKP32DRAFT_168799 [Trametes sanguinea]
MPRRMGKSVSVVHRILHGCSTLRPTRCGTLRPARSSVWHAPSCTARCAVFCTVRRAQYRVRGLCAGIRTVARARAQGRSPALRRHTVYITRSSTRQWHSFALARALITPEIRLSRNSRLVTMALRAAAVCCSRSSIVVQCIPITRFLTRPRPYVRRSSSQTVLLVAHLSAAPRRARAVTYHRLRPSATTSRCEQGRRALPRSGQDGTQRVFVLLSVLTSARGVRGRPLDDSPRRARRAGSPRTDDGANQAKADDLAQGGHASAAAPPAMIVVSDTGLCNVAVPVHAGCPRTRALNKP